MVFQKGNTIMVGRHQSEATKNKISNANKGRIQTPEEREKRSKSLTGNHFALGYKHSDETKKKESIAQHGRKHTPETRKKISQAQRGSNNPAWIDGRRKTKYCFKFNNLFKEHIREKFGRKCFLCPSTENGEKLAVHHIDYNKNSICNGQEWAFVPLCHKCHSKTTWNRHHYFNLLVNYWAINPEIDFNEGFIFKFQI